MQEIEQKSLEALKGTNERLDKVRGVLWRISNTLSDQAAVMSQTLKLNLEDREQRERLRLFNEVEEKRAEGQAASVSPAGASAIVRGPNREESDQISSGLWGAIGAALGSLGAHGGIGSVLGMGSILAGSLLRVGVVSLLAPAISDFADNLFRDIFTNFKLPPELVDQAGDAAGKAALWGALGYALLGRKAGIIAAVAGGVASIADHVLGMLNIEDKQFDFKGVKFDTGDIVGAVAGAVLLFAPKLLSIAGSTILAGLTGPLGLAVIAGGALAGAMYFAKSYIDKRRADFVSELEGKLKDFKASEVEGQQSTTYLQRAGRKVGVSSGGTDSMNQLDDIVGTVGSAAFGNWRTLSATVAAGEEHDRLKKLLDDAVSKLDLSKVDSRVLARVASAYSMLSDDANAKRFADAAEAAKNREKASSLLEAKTRIAGQMDQLESSGQSGSQAWGYAASQLKSIGQQIIDMGFNPASTADNPQQLTSGSAVGIVGSGAAAVAPSVLGQSALSAGSSAPIIVSAPTTINAPQTSVQGGSTRNISTTAIGVGGAAGGSEYGLPAGLQ